MVGAIGAVAFLPIHSPIVPWSLFPLNPPAWSLFAEMAINIAYGIWLARLRSILLVVAATLALVPLWWALTAPDTQDAYELFFRNSAPRVFFSFIAGVLVFRLHQARYLDWFPRLPVAWIGAVLLLSFAVPVEGIIGKKVSFMVVAIAYPLILIAGIYANAEKVTARLAGDAGRLSYPLYALHYPFLVGASAIAQASGIDATIVVSVGAAVAVPSALYAEKFWDTPIRAALARRIHLKRRAIEAAPGL